MMNESLKMIAPLWVLIACVWIGGFIHTAIRVRRNPQWRPRNAQQLTDCLGFDMTGQRYLRVYFLGGVTIVVMSVVACLFLWAKG
jgi:hypothetical protein